MSHVLIVEDDDDIASAVRDHLAREAITSAHTRRCGGVLDRLSSEKFEALILDVMLPDGSGFDLCRDIRAKGHQLPILFMTARSEDVDEVLGLGLGGDDYITKPFTSSSLVARVKAQLRRAYSYGDHDASVGPAAGSSGAAFTRPSSSAASRTVKLGERCIDLAAGEITSPGGNTNLTARERALLEVFIEHPNQVFTRDRLFDLVWGHDHFGDPGTVPVHIRRLREKLEDDPSQPQWLQTVRGLGYRLRAPRT
ncbi:MAG: DNA-binding response regulator [Spirochaetaceae bacterium]|nr:MAG: DNA-binding response regulator [Spirochaetaceae bacterium]